MSTPIHRWHTDPKDCAHSNPDICPTCDFDGYYAATYPDCPWRTPEQSGPDSYEWLGHER